MRDEFRWAGLVVWLTLLFLLQPLMLQAEPLELDLGGYIATGVDHYGAFYDEKGEPHTTRGVLRNAKLELELDWGRSWSAEIDGSYEVRDEKREAELGDAYVQYETSDRYRITLGRFKEPFGFERLSSYSTINTSERSLVTSAFAPGRSQGLTVGRFRKSTTWVLGVFTNEPEGESTRAVTGRYTLAPIRADGRILHLGIAASWRDLGDERFQIKDRGEVFSADNVIRSPRFDARESALLGLEGAWSSGRLSLVAETMAQQVTRVNGEHWWFTGAYLQAGVFLTNDHRRYSRGEFKRPEPTSRTGAIELVARYSAIDLQDQKLGARADVALLGANYYWDDRLQLRLNWLMPQIEGNVMTPKPEGNAVTLRVLFRY